MEHSRNELNGNTNGNKGIQFQYLPSFAAYLLENHLEEFSAQLLKFSREEDLPLLRFFSALPEEALLQRSRISNAEMLNFISENNIEKYIEKSTTRFLYEQLPHMNREEVVVDDITLISLIRRKVFRHFVPQYLKDVSDMALLMDEVDRFTVTNEAALFNAYQKIQQEKLSRINNELSLRENELLEAQSLSRMGSFLWDLKDNNSSFTPGALAIFGIEKPIGMAAFINSVKPDDRDKLKAAIDKAINENGLFECEYSYANTNVEKRIWSRGIVKFENGEAVSMKGTVMDITNTYNLLKQLQHSEAMHKEAQALTHIGNWSWDITDNTLLWSDEMYRIHGLEPQSETISFDRVISFIHPQDKEQKAKEILESLENGEAKDYFIRIILPGGELKMLKSKGEVIKGEDNRPVKINGTSQDVTREYLLNHDLQEKEKNFQQLIHNAPDAVIVIDLDSNITLWNPKTTEIFGWTSEEVMGKALTETIIPTQYKQAHEKGMKRYLQTGEATILNKTLELTACNKNKEEFYISLTISETTQAGKKAFISFIRDISLQKKTQLELQHNSALIALKNLELQRINEELESFNFAASHDLQEPLRKIQTYSSRIIDKAVTGLAPQVVSDLDKIKTASARMQKLIQDLLNFSQNTLKMQEKEVVDLNAVIEEVKHSFIEKFEENKVEIHADKLPIVKVVRFQFLQLFINLLSNAIKYQQPGVKPKIKISSSLINNSEMHFHDTFPSKNYLKISIADNGIGFEKEYAHKIFDLFIRLHNKENYSGTGIGLATCKKIVHNHEGYILAESDLEKGSTFFIYLPEEILVNNNPEVNQL